MKKIITVLFKVMAGMILIPIIILTIWFILRLFACGPDREVVRVASPVAKIIADDILINGIPKSLQDIKGLPYTLERCVRREVFKDKDRQEVSKDNAAYVNYDESCFFIKNKKTYSVNLHFMYSFRLIFGNGNIKLFNGETRTGIEYYFDYSKEKNQFILEKGSGDNPLIYDSKKTGICFRWGH